MGVMLEKLLNMIYGAISMVWVILFICWINNLSEHLKAGLSTQHEFVVALVSIPLMYVSAIAIHEAGHWFCGLWLGFVGVRFTVLWLNIERHGPRWKLRWAKRPAKLGGMVLHYPGSGHQLRLRMSLSVAAGPTANWVTGCLAVALSYTLAGGTTVIPNPAQLMTIAELQLFGLVSTFMGCFNLLPKKIRNGMSNDGLLLWYLWRREPALGRQLAVAALVGSSYKGLRPREWDNALLDRALAHTDNSILDCSAAMLAYSHHLDASRAAQAGLLLYACLAKIALLSEEHQQEMCCEAAYFEARHNQNIPLAQQWLAQAQQNKESIAENSHFALAEVALALGKHEEAQAYFQLVEAEPLVQDANDIGSRKLALDRLADLRTRLASGPVTPGSIASM